MDTSNVKLGVTRIYRAEIFEIISFVLAGIASIFVAFGSVISNNEEYQMTSFIVYTLGIIIGFVMVILLVLSFFFNFLGIKVAGKDEENFKKAFTWLLLGIIVSALGSLASMFIKTPSTGKMISDLSEILRGLFSLFCQINVIRGIQHVAEELDKPDLKKSGETTLKFVICAQVSASVFSLLSTIMTSGTDSFTLVTGTIAAISLLSGIIGYILYIVLLSNARNEF